MRLEDSFNLYDLTIDMLSDENMKRVQGGEKQCGCACYYSGTPGGSSIDSNCNKNYETEKISPKPIRCYKTDDILITE